MLFDIPRHGDHRRMRVGLLGGSFNPAHPGHLHVAQTALRALRLDQVWLLVSPGNPLKPAAGMGTLATRLQAARGIADGRRVIATDIERHLRTRYTLDTVRALRRLFPRVRFVWLIGADNLTQLPRWRRWMDILRAVPFAVLPRPTYTRAALASQAARRLSPFRRPAREGPRLADRAAPAWVSVGGRQNTMSATALRKAAAGEDLSPESPPRPPDQVRKSRSAVHQNPRPR